MKSLKGDFGSENSRSTLRLNGVFGAVEEKGSLGLEANGVLVVWICIALDVDMGRTSALEFGC